MSAQENNKGVECPECHFVIRFTMEDLLMKKNVACAHCGMVMEMEVPKEIKKHLQEITLAEKMVRNAQNFSR